MNLVIIPSDKTIGIGTTIITGISTDMSWIPSDVHAVHWDGSKGQIEYNDGKQSAIINSLGIYSQAEETLNKRFDLCCFLTCTDLFRISNWIDEGIEFLTKNQDYESFFVANKTHKNYWEYDLNKEKYSRLAKWMSVYSSRQVRKPIFREDTGLTCISRSTLWKEKKRIGDFNKIVEDDRFETSIDIHSSFDLFLANTVFDWMKENKPENLPPMPERI